MRPMGILGLAFLVSGSWASAGAQDARNTRVQIVPGTCKGAVYPEAMKAAGVEGQVTIRAVVGPTGAVEPKSIQIVKSANHGLDSAARTAFLSCHFLPARASGQPTRQLVQQSIAFVLPKKTDSLSIQLPAEHHD